MLRVLERPNEQLASWLRLRPTDVDNRSVYVMRHVVRSGGGNEIAATAEGSVQLEYLGGLQVDRG